MLPTAINSNVANGRIGVAASADSQAFGVATGCGVVVGIGTGIVQTNTDVVSASRYIADIAGEYISREQQRHSHHYKNLHPFHGVSPEILLARLREHTPTAVHQQSANSSLQYISSEFITEYSVVKGHKNL
ncbi:MAG: hypothetical protein Q7T51_04410 [Candidatus Moranbacteria bacterium]|nr:hypothetical protein [Candidatus Moranbacteria bacterium]